MTAPFLDLAYVRLAVASPEVSAAFAATRLGLQPAGQEGEKRLLRADDHAYRLAFLPGDAETAVAIELGDGADLAAAAAALTAAGFAARPATAAEADERKVRAAILTRDGSGNAVDLVIAPQRAGRRFFPGRDSGITGLASLGLRSTEIDRDTAFWAAIPGVRVTDRVGDITYLGLDARHHRLVLHPSERPGLLYLCFAVESLDHLMQNRSFLAEHQVRILQGPGRQAASDQVFLHAEGPDGVIYSLGHGMAVIDPLRHRPRQFAAADSSLCSWGSVCEAVPELHFPPPGIDDPRSRAGRTAP